jgi:hypothetical protein
MKQCLGLSDPALLSLSLELWVGGGSPSLLRSLQQRPLLNMVFLASPASCHSSALVSLWRCDSSIEHDFAGAHVISPGHGFIRDLGQARAEGR